MANFLRIGAVDIRIQKLEYVKKANRLLNLIYYVVPRLHDFP